MRRPLFPILLPDEIHREMSRITESRLRALRNALLLPEADGQILNEKIGRCLKLLDWLDRVKGDNVEITHGIADRN